MVYDCEKAIDDLIEQLRELGAEDKEIAAALNKASDDLRYKNWGDLNNGW